MIVLGIPAVVLPIELSKKGLPISLQLMGKSFAERQLLEAAKWIEQKMAFPRLDINKLTSS